MAKPKFSGIGIVDLQGTTGNITFAKNEFGTYSKPKPGAPAGSSYLDNWRVFQSLLATAWADLTDAERTEWDSYKIKRKNSFGETNSITGRSAFFSVNSNRIPIGAGYTSSPPAYKPLSQLSTFEVDFSTPGQLNITVGPFDASLIRVAILASFPLPPTRMSNNQVYAHFFVAPSAALYNQFSAYVMRYGTPSIGEKIWFKAIPISIFTGARGVPFFASCIRGV